MTPLIVPSRLAIGANSRRSISLVDVRNSVQIKILRFLITCQDCLAAWLGVGNLSRLVEYGVLVGWRAAQTAI